MHRLALAPVLLACALHFGAGRAHGQFGVGDWTTTGFDSQRSSWLRNDAKISLPAMQKPGFSLEWKVPIGDRAALTTPSMIDFYIGYRGFRALAFIASRQNIVTAIDTDLGRVEWSKNFRIPAAAPSGPCPGGMTASAVRATLMGYPAASVPRGFGRGAPAQSAVGEPGQGAVTLKAWAARNAAPPPAPPKPASGVTSSQRRPATPPPNPFAPRIQWLYILTSDGKLHSLYISNGDEPKPALSFLPANAYAQGLIVIDNVAYAATANGCGGVENGVWALDLETEKVSHWKSEASIAGTMSPAFGPEGTLYVASGGELVALEERTLQAKSLYKLSGQQFATSPLVFEFKGADMIAAVANDGTLHLVNAAKPGAAATTSPAFSKPGFAMGALSSWQDPSGTRWILAPIGGPLPAGSGFTASNGDVKAGGIAAWKVVEQQNGVALVPGWVSRDMKAPLTPIIVNGVIFAADGGAPGSNGILYALDPSTGKDLWNSAKTITTTVPRTGALAAGGSRVYVAAADGTQYTFGFPIEH